MSRRLVVAVLFLAAAVGILLDLATSAMPNPYASPPLLAWGSGRTGGVAHCSTLGGGS